MKLNIIFHIWKMDLMCQWPIKSKNIGQGYGGHLRPPLGPGQGPGRGWGRPGVLVQGNLLCKHSGDPWHDYNFHFAERNVSIIIRLCGPVHLTISAEFNFYALNWPIQFFLCAIFRIISIKIAMAWLHCKTDPWICIEDLFLWLYNMTYPTASSPHPEL